MSDDLAEEKSRLPSLWLIGGAAFALVLVLIVLYATLGSSTGDTPGPRGERGGSEENELELARQELARSTSLETCQAALQRIRSYLSQEHVTERPTSLADRDRAACSAQLGLSPEEQEEAASSTYTALDAGYLESCLLLRDAARAAVGGDEPRSSSAGLEQARAAFAWVMREVRLQGSREVVPLPPRYVLTRGWGTSLERSLVFLALLRQCGSLDSPQADLLGSLVMLPGEEGHGKRLWACGVVVRGERKLYLFDARLGIPLPGPGGVGIATLEQAQHDEKVLDQLQHRDGPHYDVTAKEARNAEMLLVCPLSAVAPRNRFLQENLLQPSVPVRLAADLAADLKTVREVVGDRVSFWQPGSTLLRRFLPPDEGGSDQPQEVLLASLGGFTVPEDPTAIRIGRKQKFQLTLVPWNRLPNAFRDPLRFPYRVGLGQQVRDLFARPFYASAQSYTGPRQLLLRGRYEQAARELMEEKTRSQQLQQVRANSPDATQQADAWLEEAYRAYAKLEDPRQSAQRAQSEAEVNELWQHSDAIRVLIGAAAADARQPEIVYLLGLCKHEQAEHLHHKKPAGPAGQASQTEQQAWKDALGWWDSYLENHARHVAATAVRRLRAQALWMLGDHAAARSALTDLSKALTGLEQLAASWEAEQLDRGRK